MIGKKISARGGGGKVARVHDLTNYVTDPGGHADPDRPALGREKCVYYGTQGFLSTDLAAQKAEMAALALAAPQSADPICHYVLSMCEGEHPSHEQVDEMVHIVLDELGLEGHQAIYALHRDTDHDHVHLVVSRVHPESERVVRAGGGWDRRALLQAVAKIEQAQGWQQIATPAAQREAAEVERRGKTSREGRRDERPRANDRARDGAHRHGERSAVEIARERAGHLFHPKRGAQTWAELHAALAARGLRYEKKGSGAVIWVGGTPTKASEVSRDASFSKLTKGLGPYQPATPEQIDEAGAAAAQHRPEPTDRAAESTDRASWAEYQRARRERQAEGRANRAALTARHRQERAGLQAAQRERRQAATAGNWRGRGAELNAIRSQLAAQDARERLVLRDRQARERHGRAKTAAKSYEDWLRQQGRGQQADSYARWIAPRLVGEDQPAVPRDIRAFSSHVVGATVEYRRDSDRRLAFVDAGRMINMTSSREDDATLAALQVAQAKWGRVQISGSSGFRECAARIAAREGIRVMNADLADIVRDERERMHRGEPPMAQPAAERDPRADELARAQAVCQRLIRDMVESGDYECSDVEWARACSDDLDTVRATCRSWAETALEDGWTVSAEALAVAGLDDSAAPSERRTEQDLGR
jgi:hypothetical protein